MNTITSLPPVTTSASSKIVLSQDGFRCSLHTLPLASTGSSFDVPESPEHLLFVVDGEITVRSGDVNTIVNKDEALRLPDGKSASVEARDGENAKVLQIEIPRRQVVTPQILTPAGNA